MAGSVEQDAPRDGIPAATVVIFRHAPDGGAPQILMQVRSRSLAFAGGMAVFPGGGVDPSDYDLAREAGYVDIDEAAHQIAAIRETLEETGLALGLRGTIDAQSAAEARAILLEEKSLLAVLERMGWSIALNDLVPFARWFPKNERLPRIFDTRFYIADLGTGAVDIAVDAQENTVTLADPLLPEVQPGRRVLLREGCDRTLATCADRFGNALNFRGEPFLPGNDMMARYPVPR